MGSGKLLKAEAFESKNTWAQNLAFPFTGYVAIATNLIPLTLHFLSSVKLGRQIEQYPRLFWRVGEKWAALCLLRGLVTLIITLLSSSLL